MRTKANARRTRSELLSYHYALMFGNGEFLNKEFLPSSRADVVLAFETAFQADKFRRDNFPCQAVDLWDRYHPGEEKPYGAKAVGYDEIPSVVYVRIYSEVKTMREGVTK